MNHGTVQSQTVSSLNGYSWHDVSNCIMDLGARLQSVLPQNETQGVRFGNVDVAPPGVYESPRDDADGRTLVHGEPRDALGGEVSAPEAAFAASSTQRSMLRSAAVAASSTQTFPDSPPDDLAAASSSSAASRSAAVAASSAQMPAQVQVDDGDLAEADSDDDDGSDGASLGGRSGDTAGTLTEAEIDAGNLFQVTRRRTEKAQPKYRVAGDLNPWREPAPRNSRKDVGNIGLFMGNWGERSQKRKKGKKGQNSADQRALHDAMDSCAMFYIGDDVVCTMDWDFNKIGDILREAARVPSDAPRSRHDQRSLDRYSGNSVPGQLWNCYKNKKKEKKSSMNLQKKLEGILEPSTTDERLQQLKLWHEQEITQLQMDRDARIATGGDPDEEEHDYLPSSPYLKLKEKRTDQREWLLDPSTGAVHNGAHFPLLLFTNNPSARSKAAYDKRRKDWRAKSAARQSWETPVWLQKGADDALSIVPGGRGRGERSSQGGVDQGRGRGRDQGRSSGWDWNKDGDWCDWGSLWSHGDWQRDEAEEWRGWR